MNKTKTNKNYIAIIKYRYNKISTNYNYNKNTTRMGQVRGRV